MNEKIKKVWKDIFGSTSEKPHHSDDKPYMLVPMSQWQEMGKAINLCEKALRMWDGGGVTSGHYFQIMEAKKALKNWSVKPIKKKDERKLKPIRPNQKIKSGDRYKAVSGDWLEAPKTFIGEMAGNYHVYNFHRPAKPIKKKATP